MAMNDILLSARKLVLLRGGTREPLVCDPLMERVRPPLILDLIDVDLLGQPFGEHEHQAPDNEERRKGDDEAGQSGAIHHVAVEPTDRRSGGKGREDRPPDVHSVAHEEPGHQPDSSLISEHTA